jgi:phage-related holin
MGAEIGINLGFTVLFGWFTLATFIINEIRSILENLVKIGVYVPCFLIKGLEVASELIEHKTEHKDGDGK